MMQDSYRELFFSESQEYLNTVNNCLVKLEENSSDFEAINEIFRCMHTLKGMAATMGYEKLAKFSHQMEDLLDELRNKRKELTPDIVNALFSSVDVLDKLIEAAKSKKQDSQVDSSAQMQLIKDLLASPNIPSTREESAQPGVQIYFDANEKKKIQELKNSGYSILRLQITLSRDCVMKEARAFLLFTNIKRIGEVVKTIPAIEELKEGLFESNFVIILATTESEEIVRQELMNVSDVEHLEISNVEALEKTISVSAPQARSYIKKIQSMRIPVERLDKIMNLMGELAIAKIRLVQTIQVNKISLLEEISFTLDHLTSALQDEIIRTRLLPVAYILDTFPRMARDLARKQGKDIDLSIVGSDIELDRVVLDEIGDPLVHLIRNAIDHGIESPEERQNKKKNPQGKVSIVVSRSKGQILIDIADDGRGVDFDAVKKTALKKGLVSDKDLSGIDEKKILDLLSTPGFSTTEKITDISGRGVGLDAVKSKIEALGGRLDFETKKDTGSRFTLTLPLTLAIIKAMLVKVNKEIFAIPLMSIRETIKIKKEEIKIIQDFEVTRVREEIIPIIRLDKNLGLSSVPLPANSYDNRDSVVIVEHGKRTLGLLVTEIMGEQDIVVKPLGSMIKRTKGVAGATILGDGRVALILDTMGLV